MSSPGFGTRPSKRLSPLVVVGVLFCLSAFIHFPCSAEEHDRGRGFRVGVLCIGPPRVLSGDSPHYLVGVHSLTEDSDFDLSNNYDQAERGDWDLGARLRSSTIDRHVDSDGQGRQLGTHSPFFVLLLSLVAWPFGGSYWVEPVVILLTIMVSLVGVGLFQSFSANRSLCWTNGTLLLALASPLWCYSRDLWSEPWVMTIWVGMFLSQNLVILGVLSFLGSLIKYPFVVVPLTMGLLSLWRGQYKRSAVLVGSSAVGLVTAVGVIQYIFRDVDHFSWFHSGIHGGFDWPLDGLAGMLLGPENGLLLFFPFLAWGLWEFRKGGDRYLPAIMFLLVHASYQDWMGGTGFSARYLVPMLPVMVLAVQEVRPQGWLFKLAVAYSLLWGAFGGFFPALVFDRSPWEVFSHVVSQVLLRF